MGNHLVLSNLGVEGRALGLIRHCLPDVMAIYAFGSQISGQAGPESDLDMAVLVPGYADPLQLWNVASQLADVLGCTVDLLDLRKASTVMQYQVITTGLRLWALPAGVDAFETYVLSEKTELDAARAGLLADIQKNGRVFGG